MLIRVFAVLLNLHGCVNVILCLQLCLCFDRCVWCVMACAFLFQRDIAVATVLVF